MFGNLGTQGGGRGGQFDQSQSRQQVLGRRYQAFANPFFDQAGTYMPSTIKALFSFCRFYFLTHGIINAICTKASEYPLTDIMLSHDNRGVVDKWEELLTGTMNYRVYQFETNLDYYVYGNSFSSPNFPFRKKLICKLCSAEHDAMKMRPNWRYVNSNFWLTCTKCGQTDWAKAHDYYYPRPSEIGMTRWNAEQIHLFHNETTDRVDTVLDPTADFRSQILMGRKDLIATTPEIFLEAVRTRGSVVFNKQQVFHMRRPTLSTMSRGWGVPLMMPVMKDAFYAQVMKKAQESVLLGHLTPQIFLFPQPATGGADPFTSVNLADWRDHIRRELARQRIDPNYYGILPFPLGHQAIGENGKSLLLMPEIQQVVEQIAVGMGFPIDLVFGSGNYAGSSVSMRMLENFFLSNVSAHKMLLKWTMNRVGAFLNWPVPTARFKPFRMADDLQRQALSLQMAQLGKISDTSLLAETDRKFEDENDLMAKELEAKTKFTRQQQMMMAEAQGEAAVVSAKYQAQAQAAAMAGKTPPPDPFSAEMGGKLLHPGHFSLDAIAADMVKKMQLMPPKQRAVFEAQLVKASPEMNQLVQQQLGAGLPPVPANDQAAAMQQQGMMQGPGQMLPAPAVDMTPMPEALPPRRAGAA